MRRRTNQTIMFGMLSGAIGTRITIGLKDNSTIIVGRLVAFNGQMNLLLEDAEEREGAGSLVRFGTLLIRGNAICYIAFDKNIIHATA